MWKVILCDDEPAMCRNIRAHLDRFSQECGIELEIREYHSGQELLDRLTSDVDLILLDIQMEPVSGMEAARRIRERDPDVCIIFITTMVQYAMEGYMVHAFGFLQKPVRYAQLRLQLLDAVRHLKTRQRELVTLKIDGQPQQLDLGKILYFEVYAHDIHVVSADSTSTYYGTLAEMEKALSSQGFFRCHKSYLVNLRRIRRIAPASVFLDDSHEIPLSKYRRKELLEAFAKRVGGHS